nr:hypothetical protein [Pseudoroseomonas coralli]
MPPVQHVPHFGGPAGSLAGMHQPAAQRGRQAWSFGMGAKPLRRRSPTGQQRAQAPHALQAVQRLRRFRRRPAGGLPPLLRGGQRALLVQPTLWPHQLLPDGAAAPGQPVQRGIEGALRRFARGGELVARRVQLFPQALRRAQPARRFQQRLGQGAAGSEEALAADAQAFGVQCKEPFEQGAVHAAEQASLEGGIQRRLVRAEQRVAAPLAAGEAEGRAIRQHTFGADLHACIAVTEAHRRLRADTEEQIAKRAAQHRLAGTVRRQHQVQSLRRRIEAQHRILEVAVAA